MLRETSLTRKEKWWSLWCCSHSQETLSGYFGESIYWSLGCKESVLYNCTYLPPFYSQQYGVQLIDKMKWLTGGAKSIAYTCNCSSLLKKSEIHWQGQQGTSLNYHPGRKKKKSQVFWPFQIACLEEKIKYGHWWFIFNLCGHEGEELYILTEKCRYGIVTKAGGVCWKLLRIWQMKQEKKMTPLNKRHSQKNLTIEETALLGCVLCNYHKKSVWSTPQIHGVS